MAHLDEDFQFLMVHRGECVLASSQSLDKLADLAGGGVCPGHVARG